MQIYLSTNFNSHISVFKQSKDIVDNIFFSYSSHNWQKKIWENTVKMRVIMVARLPQN